MFKNILKVFRNENMIQHSFDYEKYHSFQSSINEI